MTTQALIYFSTHSETCHRFVGKLGIPATRLPEDGSPLCATQPYVLLVPTYGGGHHNGAVPRPVIRFLNQPENRALLRGIIAAGNTNFGAAYGIAGDIIAAKCGVPFYTVLNCSAHNMMSDVSATACTASGSNRR